MNNIQRQNSVSQLMLRQYSRANGMTAKTMGKIASGARINQAMDDASGLAMAKKLEALTSGISEASRNSQDAVSMLQTADGALGNVGDMLGRMNELASRAANGTLGDEERSILQEEYDQLAQEIDRVGQSTTFNGNQLFDGSTYTMQVGAEAGDTMDIKMKEMSAAALGLNKVDLTTQRGAGSAMSSVKDAIKGISRQRSAIGAAENGLKSVLNNLGNSEINLTESISRIMDSDIAKESINMSISSVLNQTSIAMMKNSQHLMQYNAVQLLMR